MSLRTRLLLAFAAVVLIPIALLAFGLRQEMTKRLCARVPAPCRSGGRDHSRRSRSRKCRDCRAAGVARERAAERQPVSSRRRLPASSRNGTICSTMQARRCASPVYRCFRFRMATTGSSALVTSGTSMAVSSPDWCPHCRARAALRSSRLGAPSVSFWPSRVPSRSRSAGGRSPLSVAWLWTNAFLARLAPRPGDRRVAALPRGRAVDGSAKAGHDRRLRGRRAAASGDPDRSRSTARSRAGAARGHSASHPAQGAPAQCGFMVSSDGRGNRQSPRCCWRCGCRRESADRWRLLRKRRPSSISIASTSTSIPARTKSADLSRLLGDLAARLRTSTARVREAERRATVGELARQINHDIKNGLIPLRNVMRHLAQVERDEPGALPGGIRRAAANGRFQHRVSRDAGHELPATVAAVGPARVRSERAHRGGRARRAGARGCRVRDRPGECSRRSWETRSRSGVFSRI